MATTINSGYANSPKLTANIADHADVYGGRALVFDGVIDYLDCGAGLGNQLGDDYSGGLTFSMWLNVSGMTTNDGIFQFHISGLECGTIFESNKIAWYLNGSKWSESSVISTGNWFNLVCVLDTSSHSNSGIYINGIKDSTGTATNFPSAGALDFSGKTFLLGKYFNDTFTYHGKMTDVKVFNSALTESQLTELYIKPENTPSAVQDSLVAWYPMCEGNPDSPQSIVYDHSEKKLSANYVTNSTFDSDISGWSQNNSDSERTISHATVDGRTCIDINDASTSSRFNAQFDLGNNAIDGELYKISYFVRKSQTGSTSKDFIVGLGFTNVGADAGNVDKTVAEYDTWEFQEIYIICGTANNHLQFLPTAYDNSHIGRLYLDDVKVQKVLMSNHATTNFFGSELIDSNARTFEGTSTYGWAVYGNNTITNDSNTLKITRVDNNQGAYLYLRDATDLTTNLTVSTTYLLKGDFLTTDASKTFTVRISNTGGTDIAYNNLNNTSFVTKEFEFVAGHATNAFIVVENLATDGVVKVDNLTLKEVGISSSGFMPVTNEPVVPQVPLMRYNQKMFFGHWRLNTHVDIGQPFNFGKKVTISVWLIPNEIISSSRTGIIGGRYFTDGDFHLGLHDSTRKIMFTPSASTGGQWDLNENEWDIGKLIHLCLVYDTSEQGDSGRDSNKLYVNGILKSTSTGSGGTVDLQTSSLNIGHTNQREYNGFLDEVSIFSSAFTLSQVQELFNDGVAYDATTHSKASALKAYYRNDGVTTWKNRGDKFASFDGVNDVITRNAINVDYKSVSFWMRPSTTATTASSSYPVMTFFDWSYSAVAIGSATSTFTNELIMIQENVGGGVKKTAFIPSGGETIPSDSWTHIAFVWNGSNYDIYFNGVKKSVVANTGETNGGHVPLSTNRTLRFGHGGASGATFYNGDLTGIAIWSESLTDAQVLSIYNAGQNGNIASIQSSDLELYYTFNPHASTDADTNLSVQDRSGNDNDSNSITGAVIDKDGTVNNTPDSITIREGLNVNRDGLGFYFTNPSSNVLRLNGVDEYLLVDKTGSFPSGDQSRSITCWIKPHSFPSGIDQPIVFMGTYDGNQMFTVSFLYNSTNRISVWGYNNDYTGSDVLTIDNWWYVGVTYDSGTNTLKSYIGGGANNINPALDINNTSVTDFNTTYGDIKIGRAQNKYFDGMIDEVKIYNRALSADEILKDFKHQKGKHKND